MSGRIPDAIREYVGAVADRVAGVFGADVVGVYTTGSLALGAFHPGRSDVDLMGVVEQPDPQRCEALARRLDHRVLPCPAAGLEFVLYPRVTVTSAALDAGYLLNLNTGRELAPRVSLDPAGEPAYWYVIDRAVTYQSGQAILGSPPRQLFEPIGYARLLPVVIASVEAQRKPEPGDLLDNAVLNACRALRFAADRRWYAKLEAAERTLPTAGSFAPLVGQAIAVYRLGRRAGVRLPADEVQSFLAYVVTELCAS